MGAFLEKVRLGLLYLWMKIKIGLRQSGGQGIGNVGALGRFSSWAIAAYSLRHNRKLGIALFCLLFLFGCQPKAQTTTGDIQVKVARVANGQTLEVVGMGQQPTLISQVRLVGIDAPDIRQYPWGDDAKEKLNQLIGENRSVILEFDLKPQDEFNRVFAYAWVNNTLVNEQLVKDGYVLFSPRSPNQKYDQRLERAQQWARLMGLGIWNPDKPMRLTPSEFRQMNK